MKTSLTGRLIVLGGRGFFGHAAVDALREMGLSPLIASRRPPADVVVDAENSSSLRKALQPGDVLLDAAGPFQNRTTALMQAAMEIGCDVVDLADSLAYVRSVYELRETIAAARPEIRVLTACSSVSAVSAAMVALSGLTEPVRITGLMVPATRHSAVRGTADSLFQSVGKQIETYRDGKLDCAIGFVRRASFQFPSPIGRRAGYAFETADSLTLPDCFPCLRTADYYVDTNVLGLNTLFRCAARLPWLRGIIGACQKPGVRLARWLGRSASGLGYEIEDAHGRVVRLALIARENGYRIAIAPAVLAAAAMMRGEFPHDHTHRGLVPPNLHRPPVELIDYLRRLGVEFVRL